jgi:hypothetical protein
MYISAIYVDGIVDRLHLHWISTTTSGFFVPLLINDLIFLWAYYVTVEAN